MNSKTSIWIGTLVGTSIGGVIPTLWGANMLSASSVIFGGIGGLIGIYIGFKMSQY